MTGLILMRLAAGRPVGPITTLTAERTQPDWNYITYRVWIIKKYIYPYFSPKIRKLAIQPMETSNGYNSGSVKDRCKMLAPKGGFRGQAI